MRKYGISNREFASKVGISLSALSRYLNDEYKTVSHRLADKIVESYPDISRVWLLTGDGEMLKSVNIEGSGNIANGNGNTAHVGVSASDLVKQLEVKDEQIRKGNSQIDRLLAIIERMQGV